MTTNGQRLLEDTADRIDEIVENLERIAEWANDENYLAIQHKIQEGLGSIEQAAIAARQYEDGTLERKEAR